MQRTGQRWITVVSQDTSKNMCGSMTAPENSLMWRKSVGVTDTYDGRAVAVADLWNRGVMDVIVANQRGPLLIYKNTVTPTKRWIEIELEGTKSNRSAIGAQVTLYLERAAAGAERFRRKRVCCAESETYPFWVGKESYNRKGRHSLAIGIVQTLENLSLNQLSSEGAPVSRQTFEPGRSW